MNAQQQTKESLWSGIDVLKVVAGTLAAVSAAVIGSFLGVAGTLIGAAVASLVGTIGQELYAKSLNRGYRHLQTIGVGFQTPVTAPSAMGTPAVHTPAEDEPPGHIEPVTQQSPGRIRWRRVALAAGAVFLLAMGAVTAVEAIARESIAGLVGQDDSGSSSTFGGILSGDSQPASTTPVDPNPSATPTSDVPATDPSAQPTATAPTTDATTEAPTTTTQAPAATEAPGPTGKAPAEQQAPAGDAPAE